MSGFKNLIVYQKAFALAHGNFCHQQEISQRGDLQSSRSNQEKLAFYLCMHCRIASKKKYPDHFLSKLTDADMENSEMSVWIDFSFACKYIAEEDHRSLLQKNEEVGRILGDMINKPGKFL